MHVVQMLHEKIDQTDIISFSHNEDCNWGPIFRSNILDAFSDVESECLRLLTREKPSEKSSPGQLGQIAEALGKLTASPTLSKDKVTQLASKCEELRTLLPIRNDIVHARMLHVETATGNFLSFTNSANRDAKYPACRLFTKHQCKELTQDILSISRRLKGLIESANQPSPPKPSPGAAAGL
jgi:hypothetical protein